MKFLLLILILFTSCGQNNPKNTTVSSKDSSTEAYLKKIENPITIYREDTSLFTHIKYDFYKDSTGKLFWKYRDDSRLDTFFIYYTAYFCKPFSNEKIYFKDFIDIDTYKELDSCLYSEDKNHVFYFHPCSCGGMFYIVKGADLKTFRHIGSYKEGVDKNYFYFQGSRKERRKSNS